MHNVHPSVAMSLGSESVSALVQSAPADDGGSDRRDNDDNQRHGARDKKDVAVNVAVEVVLLAAAVQAPVCNKCQSNHTYRQSKKTATNFCQNVTKIISTDVENPFNRALNSRLAFSIQRSLLRSHHTLKVSLCIIQ